MREIRQRLDAGESFADLAEAYSVDAQSKARGGDIGFIGYDAPIHESFKDAAFELEEVGDVSEIVDTPYGYHIITLTEVREMKSFEDAYEELKQLAARLPRTKSAEENLARKVIEDRAAVVDTAFVLNAFRDVPADSVFPRIVQKDLSEDAIAHPILVIGDSTYTLAEVSEFAASSQLSVTGDTEDRLMSLLTAFVTESAIEFEAGQLEDRDDEFARLMNEFRDGLILFQFMEDSVWTAAEQDSVALEQYYEANKDDYWWQDRTRIISFQSKSDSLLSEVGRRLDAGESIADLQASFEGDTLQTVTSDTMMIADPTKSVYDQALDIPQGEHTDPISFRGAFVLLVNDGVEAARQKSFAEARTQVVSDFQTIVEDRLIERLRAQYNVRTFPSRLQSAFASVAADDTVDEVARGE
jgi:peptidyl-prolyl cis-trans isomerase SurA